MENKNNNQDELDMSAYDDFLDYQEAQQMEYDDFINESNEESSFNEMDILNDDFYNEDFISSIEEEPTIISNENIDEYIEVEVNKTEENDTFLNPDEFMKKIKFQHNMPMFVYSTNLFIGLGIINFIVFAYTVMNKNYGLAGNALIGVLLSVSLVMVGNKKLKNTLEGEWISTVKNPDVPFLKVKQIKTNYTIIEVFLMLVLTLFGWMGMLGILLMVSNKPGPGKLKAEGYTLYKGMHNCKEKYIFSNGNLNDFNLNYNRVIYEDNRVIILQRK